MKPRSASFSIYTNSQAESVTAKQPLPLHHSRWSICNNKKYCGAKNRDTVALSYDSDKGLKLKQKIYMYLLTTYQEIWTSIMTFYREAQTASRRDVRDNIDKCSLTAVHDWKNRFHGNQSASLLMTWEKGYNEVKYTKWPQLAGALKCMQRTPPNFSLFQTVFCIPFVDKIVTERLKRYLCVTIFLTSDTF